MRISKRIQIFYRILFSAAMLLGAVLNCTAQSPFSALAGATSPQAEASDSEINNSESEYTSPELIAQKIREKSLSDAKELHFMARSTVQFIRENISEDFADFLSKKYFGIRGVVVLLSVLIVGLAWALQRFVIAFIFRLLLRTKNGDTVKASRLILSRLRSPISWFVILMALDAAILLLSRNPDVIFFARRVSTVLFFVLLCWALQILSDALFKIAEERVAIKYAATKNLLFLGNRIMRYAIYTITCLVILDTLGANITAVVASLGIGGAALAFASKDTIANFFGSMSLIIDRPFVVGDWISAAGVEGIVEFIGFRSTRIRTFPRTVVSIPNFVLANETVENWSKRNKRRVTMTVGLTYSTTAEQIVQIVEDIKTLLKNNPKVDSSDVRVNFSGFGDSSLDISILYYVFELDPIPFGEAVQDVNIDIMRAVQKRNLSFAFPSRSLYVETLPEKK